MSNKKATTTKANENVKIEDPIANIAEILARPTEPETPVKKIKQLTEIKKLIVQAGSATSGCLVSTMADRLACTESNVNQHLAQLKNFYAYKFYKKDKSFFISPA